MDQQPFDSESYWNRSASKAFSFDDDTDDVYQELSATASGQRNVSSSGVLNDDAISEASFDNTLSSRAVGVSLSALVSEETLKALLIEQTLDDRIVTKGVTPEEELKLLRRQLQATLYVPSAKTTAHKLLQGKIVPLEAFKSLQEKKQLLDAVLECGNVSDAIITVLLFLEKTLNTTNFHAILEERPRALRQYLRHLKIINPPEAIKLMQIFNKHNEAALMQFHEAITSPTRLERKQKLQPVIEKYSKHNSIVPVYQQIFHANLKLVDFLEKEHSTLGEKLHLNATPIEVLHACCSKYTNWKEQDLEKSLSPYRLAAEQQISPAQFEWTALNERANAQAYADLEFIFERVPTWHPMNKKQFHISFSLEAAIVRLFHLNAPDAVLYFFLSKMSNHDEKLELARRVHCTKAIIDALTGLKDVAQLTELQSTLGERSEEQFYCERALKNLQTKRWSTDNIKLKL